MAWTAPRTWTTSEVVSATIMNTHIRDNLLWLYGARVTADAVRQTSVTYTTTSTSWTLADSSLELEVTAGQAGYVLVGYQGELDTNEVYATAYAAAYIDSTAYPLQRTVYQGMPYLAGSTLINTGTGTHTIYLYYKTTDASYAAELVGTVNWPLVFWAIGV